MLTKTNRSQQLLCLAFLASLSPITHSQSFEIPNVFSDGTPGKAAEVNENFQNVQERLLLLEQAVSDLKALHAKTGQGFCGQAISFTASGKYDGLSIPGTETLAFEDAFTLELRAKVNDIPQQEYVTMLIDTYEWRNDQRQFYLALTPEGQLAVWWSNSGKLWTNNGFYMFTPGSIPLNEWVHLAAVWDGANVKLMVDGKLSAEGQASIGPYQGGRDELAIGGSSADEPGANLTLDGMIDEVRISNIARYSGDFTIPTEEFSVDENTLLLMHFSGDTKVEGTYGGGTLGLLKGGTTIVDCLE